MVVVEGTQAMVFCALLHQIVAVILQYILRVCGILDFVYGQLVDHKEDYLKAYLRVRVSARKCVWAFLTLSAPAPISGQGHGSLPIHSLGWDFEYISL
jgi:hypothetical protein